MKGYTMKDEVKALVTTEFDKTDKALDEMAFCYVAISEMMGGYSDNVVNGLVETLKDATDTVRSYVNAARRAMLDTDPSSRRDLESKLKTAQNDFEDAAIELAESARGCSHVLTQMGQVRESDEHDRAAYRFLSDGLSSTLDDFETKFRTLQAAYDRLS